MRNRAGNTRPGFTFFGGLAGAAFAADPLIELHAVPPLGGEAAFLAALPADLLIEVRSVATLGGEAALPARFRSAHARAGPGHPFTSSARSSLPGSYPSSQPTKHLFPLASTFHPGSTPGAQAPMTTWEPAPNDAGHPGG